MKKYKRFIKLELENIREIIALPVFRGFHKSVVAYDYGDYTTYYFEFETDMYQFVGKLGGWVAEDICGHWMSMTEQDYILRKDEEI